MLGLKLQLFYHVVKFIGLFLLAWGCQNENQRAELSTAVQTQDSLIKEIVDNRYDVLDLKVYKPANLVTNLLKDHPEQRLKEFVRVLLNSNKKFYDPNMVVKLLETTFGFSRAADNLEFDDEFINQIIAIVKNDPALLNYFPSIGLADIPPLQKLAFDATNAIEIDSQLPYKYPSKALTAITLKVAGEDCLRPKASKTSFHGSQFIYSYLDSIDHHTTVSCFHSNSNLLALLINELSNGVFKEPYQRTVKIDDGENIYQSQVTNFQNLLALFKKAQFNIEIYTKRTFVDFFNLTFLNPNTNEFFAIRSPLWTAVKLGDAQEIMLPMEHGDYGLLVYKAGTKQRFAQVRYYMGIPLEQYPGQISLWRPVTYKDHPWQNARIEYQRVYDSDVLDQVEPWLVSSAYVMKAFQTIYGKYQLPYNGYGLNVCTDSVALTLAKYQELTSQEHLGRMIEIFPLIRAGQVTDQINLEREIFDLVGLDYNFLKQHYPSDHQLMVNDITLFKNRVSHAFDKHDLTRFGFFEDLQAKLQAKLWD